MNYISFTESRAENTVTKYFQRDAGNVFIVLVQEFLHNFNIYIQDREYIMCLFFSLTQFHRL